MCGFVCALHPETRGPVEAERLHALLPYIRHRGPDQEALHLNRGVGIAAARLAVRPGPEGDQPLVAREGAVVLAFNGDLLDRVPRGASDSRWLLERYLKARTGRADGDLTTMPGLEAVREALRGAMGVAVIVDHDAGWFHVLQGLPRIKPLHFGIDDEGVYWIASELTPLLAAVPAWRQATPESLGELVMWHGSDAGPFDGPSGGCDLQSFHVALEDGWATDDYALLEGAATAVDPRALERPLGSLDEEWVRAVWGEAARAAADVDGPINLFLSGGLDSAAVAAWSGREDLRCLTGRFEGDAFDESADAASVARHIGLPHEIVDLTDADLLADLDDVVRALEMPVGGPGSLALWRMAKRAQGHGRVVLTGTGGDELFGGYTRLALLLGRAGAWTEGYEPLAARIEEAGAHGMVRLAAAFDRTADLKPLFDPAFAETLEPPPLDFEFARGLPRADSRDALLLRMGLRVERRRTLPTLLHIEDRVLMHHGLEGRPVACLGGVPALALGAPDRWLIGEEGEGKSILRAALEGAIPESVRTHRRKRGFPTPFARAARGAGRARAEAVLADQRFRERGWWNVEACRSLLDAERPAHDRALWMVLAWETWARLFLDGDRFRETPTA